ncbi:hypothetical protein [Cellulomonas fengjieae]|uniref:hypothetical protein n=1 Tax=Cellulomonas fengjieae TaxID=2819978 RepID=UPI001AAF1C2D|nr:hypothetical protein [Cellulomonas fengjieae]MBO3102330.1 hypothetical protein [Cellulomonas fengjieae]
MSRPEPRLVRLLLRRHRGQLSAWTGLLVVLTGATTSAYQTTYATAEQRRAATELAQHNAASTVLYGVLAGEQPAHMFVWEIGAFATILAGVMAVVTAVAMTRAGEDDGTVELLRGSGVPPAAPLHAALLALAAVASVVALGCGAAVALSTGRVDGITWPGALLFGTAVGTTFLLTAYLTVVVAQVAPTATGARSLGFTLLAGAFLLRATADVQDIPWLNHLSVLGLRASVRPFDGNRAWAALVAVAVAAGLGGLSVWLARRREHGAGLVARGERRMPRRIIGSGLGLTARLVSAQAARWTVAVACLGTAFDAMGSGAVEQAWRDQLGGFLGTQVGALDPVAGFLGYVGTLVAIGTCAFALLSILTVSRDETAGRTDLVLSTGTRRWAPLAWRVVVTGAASLVLLLVTGALAAVVTPQVMDGDDVARRALASAVGQWPAVLALIGWGAFVVGRWPRRGWLTWVPLVLSSALVLLGGLLGVGERIQDLAIFGHVPDVAVPDPQVGPLVLLAAVGVAGALLGVWAVARRDVASS